MRLASLATALCLAICAVAGPAREQVLAASCTTREHCLHIQNAQAVGCLDGLCKVFKCEEGFSLVSNRCAPVGGQGRLDTIGSMVKVLKSKPFSGWKNIYGAQ